MRIIIYYVGGIFDIMGNFFNIKLVFDNIILF